MFGENKGFNTICALDNSNEIVIVKRIYLCSAARLDGLLGQRWKTETVISVIKRKLGDTIRSRKTHLRDLEPIIKGLVYNIHR